MESLEQVKPATFPDSNMAKLTVFSYLTGYDLLCKIALLDKKTRQHLPTWHVLDQPKVVAVKCFPSAKLVAETKLFMTTQSFDFAKRLLNGF